MYEQVLDACSLLIWNSFKWKKTNAKTKIIFISLLYDECYFFWKTKKIRWIKKVNFWKRNAKLRDSMTFFFFISYFFFKISHKIWNIKTHNKHVNSNWIWPIDGNVIVRFYENDRKTQKNSDAEPILRSKW